MGEAISEEIIAKESNRAAARKQAATERGAGVPAGAPGSARARTSAGPVQVGWASAALE
jgi:hypothetical protein